MRLQQKVGTYGALHFIRYETHKLGVQPGSLIRGGGLQGPRGVWGCWSSDHWQCGERNDNVRVASGLKSGVVLQNDAIRLTREQRLSGDKLNGMHGLIHCKGAQDWHLFGVALPRMFVSATVCAIVSRTVIFKIESNAIYI
jgi:hypothetical protein